ncbi:MAG: pilus assembly protein PilM [Candidatus Pacebacteria bacterium]|nr:pilus assembly protein PilM [Candidatus Paceibacterota bacterium]
MLFKRKKNYFALTFSDQKVFLVQADQKGQPVIASSLALAPGIIVRGWVKKPKELLTYLKKFLFIKKLKSKFVVVGLPEVAAFSRVLSLPPLSPAELDDAVRWQSEPLLPLSLEAVYLDWMLLEQDRKSSQVLVMALPAKLVEGYAQVLEFLGFEPVAFEPTSLSLARLTGKSKDDRLAIKVDEGEATLVIVGPRGEIKLSSTINFGSQDKQGKLLTSIQDLLAFYQKKQVQAKKKTRIAGILFCGQGSSETLAAEVSQKFQIKAGLIPIKPAELAITVSLSRKDVAAPLDEKTINLIPPRIQGVYDRNEKSRILSNWVKLWLFGLFLILFSFGVATAKVYFELQKIKGELIEVQALLTPQMDQLAVRAKMINIKASQILALTASQQELLPLIEVVKSAAPAGIDLQHWSIDFTRGEYLINGFADHQDQLINFRQRLEQTGQLSQVRIPLSSLEKEESISFTISFLAIK